MLRSTFHVIAFQLQGAIFVFATADARMRSEPAAITIRSDGRQMRTKDRKASIGVSAAENRHLSHGIIPHGLLDGCSKILLDVGANAGVHPRMLFEPELYQRDAHFLGLADKYFGPPDLRRRPSNESGICAVAFEGNPNFADRHKAIQAAYKKKGWRVDYFTPLIISTTDDDVQFYMSDNLDDTLGSSMVNRDADSPKRQWSKRSLPAIDFAKFVKTHVLGRNLPADSKDDVVFMKMDIEGGEFAVIPHMRKAGVLCGGGHGIDAMLVEEHTRIVAPATHGNFTSWPDIQYSVQQQTDCKAPAKMVDDPEDEVYFNDPNHDLP